MRAKRRAVTSALVAVLVAAVTATGARADTVAIAPAGNGVTAASNGQISLTVNQVATVSCRQVVLFSLNAESDGVLTPLGPDPTQNPQIGTLTGGTSSDCDRTVSITNLGLGIAGLFAVYAYAQAGNVTSLYVDRFLFLIALGFSRCLYRVRFRMTYDRTTGVLTYVDTTVQSMTVLAGFCPTAIGVAGSYTFSVPQTVDLT